VAKHLCWVVAVYAILSLWGSTLPYAHASSIVCSCEGLEPQLFYEQVRRSIVNTARYRALYVDEKAE
jgi:hypothetical protein